jgi:1-deoxy-D-xylulose-5-phosphate reductoisomerase
MKRSIAILGSTGSIGTQALEVIRNHPDRFSIEVLTAGNNVELLIKQAMEFVPNAVVIGNTERYSALSEALATYPIKVFAGPEALEQVVAFDTVDVVITAMVGFSGLIPTLAAIRAGKAIALANKETLVVAGQLVMELAAEHNATIIPVDSEHSAIYQCLAGEYIDAVDKIILTASGGPFLGMTKQEMEGVTVEQALNHPQWCMGPKISVDSATMMNKGLELIEARWLFGIRPDQLQVVIHPQSVIHSMVQFRDGSIKAQMGLPDMRLPIQYALSYPDRYEAEFSGYDFGVLSNLTFQPPDTEIFRNLALSFKALEKGGNWPCLMNAANEVAVEAFLNGKIGFLSIPEIIEQTLEKSIYIEKPAFEDYLESDAMARKNAKQLIG